MTRGTQPRTAGRIQGPATVLLALSCLLAGTGTVLAATPARSATGDPLPVAVELTAISPTALTPAGTLVVTGRVHNTGSTTLPAVTVALRARGLRLTTRADVEGWLAAGPEADAGARAGGSQPAGVLAPGASAGFRFQVRPRDLGLTGSSSFGPRGLSVEASTSGGERLGLSRATLVWQPDTAFDPTPVTVLVPLTAAIASADAGAPAPDVLAALTPDGRLGRVLAATAGPAVAWAIDPALLAAAEAGANPAAPSGTTAGPPGVTAQAQPGRPGTPAPPATSATTAPATPSPAGVTPAQAEIARTWLADLRSGLAGRDVTGLPYADPDLVALLRQHGGDLLATADASARRIGQQVLGAPLDMSVGWPAGGAADTTTLATLAGDSRTAIVLDGRTQPPRPGLSYTPSARSDVPAGRSRMAGLLYDDELSGLLVRTSGGGGVVAGQQLLAELAAITLERPFDPRPQLLVLPRDWDPDPGAVQAALRGLRGAAWVSMTPLSDLRGRPPARTPRPAPAYPATARRQELPAPHVAAVVAASRRLDLLGPALVDPVLTILPLKQRALSLVSTAWRSDPAGLPAARAPFIQEVAQLSTGVSVILGGPYNLLTGSAELPLRVTNSLPAPVRVELTLRPRSGRLLASRSVRVELPAHSTRLVRVPVRAVADGNVQVETVLTSNGGTVIGRPTLLQVRIRRNWETRGVVVIGGVLALVLLAGLIRSVRRGRTRVPARSVPDIDDLLLYGPATDSAAGPAPDDVPAGPTDLAGLPGVWLEPDGPPAARPDQAHPQDEPHEEGEPHGRPAPVPSRPRATDGGQRR